MGNGSRVSGEASPWERCASHLSPERAKLEPRTTQSLGAISPMWPTRWNYSLANGFGLPYTVAIVLRNRPAVLVKTPIPEGGRCSPRASQTTMQLELSSGKIIDHPSEEEIGAHLSAEADREDFFAILGINEMTYLQVAGTVAGGFTLEYQVDSLDQHYWCTDEPLTLAQIIVAFQEYSSGDESWHSDLRWARDERLAPVGRDSPLEEDRQDHDPFNPKGGCLGILLLAACLSACAVNRGPSLLSPQEIADGWILLFDGQTRFGWTIQGRARVVDDALVLGGGQETKVAPTCVFGANLVLRFEAQAEARDDAAPRIGFLCGDQVVGDWPLLPAQGKVTWQKNTIDLGYDADAKASHLHWTADGRQIKEESIRATSAACRTGLAFFVPSGCRLSLRNVMLKPLGLEPIFNGKDLTGWKAIPDRPSRFEVTDRGELSITDGPGDLQTEGQWTDFVLQLDIKTNGKHLNSGVFFRATPGQFWSGYESQIRNQWQNGDRGIPVDFGTGGIYGHRPARRVVSNDNEWFTKTIVAHGAHLAVWVNGYQVSDFTDPAGTRLGEGAISLQGHDPTTDLSFRNLRLAELPVTAPGSPLSSL